MSVRKLIAARARRRTYIPDPTNNLNDNSTTPISIQLTLKYD